MIGHDAEALSTGCREHLTGAALSGVLLLVAPTYVLAAPVLMVLEHVQAGQRVTTPVEDTLELVQSPHAGKPQPKWSILAGDATRSSTRPPDRVVHLFQTVGLQHALLCTINVRYFKDRGTGLWVPNFLLQEEPLVVRRGGRWQAISPTRGADALIVLTSSTLPNAEGYYPSLEFGLTTGLTTIDAWVVR